MNNIIMVAVVDVHGIYLVQLMRQCMCEIWLSTLNINVDTYEVYTWVFKNGSHGVLAMPHSQNYVRFFPIDNACCERSSVLWMVG